MNFIIAGANVRLLARTIHFLSKIGDELFIEATTAGLSLKAINQTNTAYAAAHINVNYFISFKQGAVNVMEENCCKVSMKPMTRIFKSLSKIITCKIWLQLDRMKIIFQFKCKSEILKTHTITLLENEHISTLQLPQDLPNKMVGEYKMFYKMLLHFHNSVEEITFDVNRDKVVISNYIENVQTDRSSLRSTFTINSSAFKEFLLKEPSTVTFCFKEFKAMSCYANHNKVLVELSFGEAGTPIVVQIKKDNVLNINFTMGTMRPKKGNAPLNRSAQRKEAKLTNPLTAVADSERIDSCHSPVDADYDETDQRDTDNTRPRRKSSSPGHSAPRQQANHARLESPNAINDSERIDSCHSPGNTYDPASEQALEDGQQSYQLRGAASARISQSAASVENERIPEPRRSQSTSKHASTPVQSAFLEGFRMPSASGNSQRISASIKATPRRVPLSRQSKNRTPLLATPPDDLFFEGNSDDPNSESPIQSNKRRLAQDRDRVEKKRIIDVEVGKSPTPASAALNGTRITIPDSVPESPEAVAERKRKQEKMRHIFKKCFEATFDPSKMPGSSQIYAENSDDED